MKMRSSSPSGRHTRRDPQRRQPVTVRPLLLIGTALVAAGCNLNFNLDGLDLAFNPTPADCPELGKLGRAGFSYAGGKRFGSYGCQGFLSLFTEGASLDELTLAEGAEARIEIIIPGNRALSEVPSTVPEVASFAILDRRPGVRFVVSANATRAGSTDLILIGIDGAEIDRATVRVAKANGVTFPFAHGADDMIGLAGTRLLTAAAPTLDGELLAGNGAVRFWAGGEVAITPAAGSANYLLTGDIVAFEGRPGSTLFAEAGGVTRELRLPLVDGSAITSVDINPPVVNEKKKEVYVRVRGSTGEVGVAGVGCTWLIDSPDVSVEGPLPPAWIDVPFPSDYAFRGPAGPHHALCVAPGWRAIDVSFSLP